MSRLTDLIAQAKAADSQLGADLDLEFKVLSSRLPFGLNFERHRPEAVELPQRRIRKGDKVRVLSARGSLKKGDQRLWHVKGLRKNSDGRVADLELSGWPNLRFDPSACRLRRIFDYAENNVDRRTANNKIWKRKFCAMVALTP